MGEETAIQTHRCAVIGRPVSHSLSPVLHSSAYQALDLTAWEYERWEVEPSELTQCLAKLSAPVPSNGPVWHGYSVTMPYKQAVIPLLDLVDPLAEVTGAVNTVVTQRAGNGAALLAGFNTDVAGIAGAIREQRQSVVGLARQSAGKAVVLGSGATACSALAALTELGAEQITVAARRHAGPGRAASAAHRMGLDIETLTWDGEAASCAIVAERMLQAELVVSTLPAGVADKLAGYLADGQLSLTAALLDVVYDPWPTKLAQAWQQAGGTIVPGWLMLLHQAWPQVRLMTGKNVALEPMRLALEQVLSSR